MSCGVRFSPGEPLKQKTHIAHYIFQRFCSRVGFDLHNKPQGGKYFYLSPPTDETENHPN